MTLEQAPPTAPKQAETTSLSAATGSCDVEALKAAAAATADLEVGFVALTDDAGLKKRVLKEGSGKQVPKGANVEVHYVGTLYPSGTKFDASRDRNAPFTFRLGQGQVIQGWDVGVQTMRVGELAELLCKPEYAYGASGSPPTIPPDSTLKFEVEVLGFEEVAETPEQHWEVAKAKREEGNRAFRDGNFAAAKAAYKAASDHMSEADEAEGTTENERKALTVAVEGNLAMCCLKLAENKAAAKWCDAVLKQDPLNVKAYYRRGLAYLAMSEFDRAVMVVEEGIAATSADPASSDLKAIIDQIRKAKQKAEKKERSFYQSMFN